MKPSSRLGRAADQLAYVALGVPLGIAYLLLIALGLLLGAIRIGGPLLAPVTRALWRCATVERSLANRLLDARVPPLPHPAREAEGGPWRRMRARMGDGPFRRAVGLLALRLPASVLAALVEGAALALVVALVGLGVEGVAGTEHGSIGPFLLGVPLGIVLWLLAIPAVIVTVALLDAISASLRALARALLAARLPAGGPVRELLADSLGDRTLSIAYWLPDRRTFVDEAGIQVPLPEPGSDRAWTAVDYEGRRVAAIIHDAYLDASPELVQAAAAAASLALDNERLKADLRARVEELRASRIRIVEAADAARAKLERDLHDGAQQQLVALAVDLRILRGRVGDNPQAGELIGQIEEKLSAALAELRELARGIHPAVLTQRGLLAAVDALAARSPLPVRCDLELAERPPAPVEAAAYFVIAEGLTNVAKYAAAERATVRARQLGDELVVEIEDDGIGGADPDAGSGLRGLRDRLAALDGTLSVSSPQGGGTVVRARIPRRVQSLSAAEPNVV